MPANASKSGIQQAKLYKPLKNVYVLRRLWERKWFTGFVIFECTQLVFDGFLWISFMENTVRFLF